MLPPHIAQLVATLSLNGNFIRDAWDKLAPVEDGPRYFSDFIGKMAPYSGSIGAVVTSLAPGRCTVVLEDRQAVRNHLGSVHAIALVNLAELAGNLALTYGLPDSARFIVAGLSIEYIKKARGRITATTDMPPVASAEKREYDVPVTLTDEAGVVVAKANLRTLVGPRA